MSGGGNSGEMSQDASSGNDGKKDGPDPSIYEDRGPKKIVRLITVMAYIFSVSFVAIVLSGYYVFLWEPPNPRLLHTSRYRGEPDVQYLQAHPSFEPSGPHTHDYQGHFLLAANNHLTKTQRPLASAPVNAHYSGDRNALNKSLEVLRSSIVNILRGYENASINQSNASSKNVTKLSVNNETTTSKAIVFSTNFKNSTANNPKVPSAVKSAVISGTGKIVHLDQINQLQKNNDSMRTYDERDEYFSLNTAIKKELPNTPTEADLHNFKSLVTSEKKEDQQFPTESVPHASIDHSLSSNKQLLRSNTTEPVDRSTKRSILSSRNLRPNVSVKFLKEMEMQSTQRSQDATNSRETQVENLATRSTAMDSEELSNVTTPQQKGLLTLLIESTDMEKISSTVMTATTSSPPAEGNATVQISDEKIS